MDGAGVTTTKILAWVAQKLGAEIEDLRAADWLLMSQWTALLIAALYLIMCTIGQRLMKDRKAWDLKGFIIFYNFALVILSLYMFIEIILVTAFNPKFNLACAAVDVSSDPMSLRLLSVLWLHYVSKYVELIETLIFVLRKKNNQISFLHVYHHSSVILLWLMVVQYAGGGSSYFAAVLNSLVHTFMYLYYMLSAIGERMRPYLWWKKYLTSFQMIQFALILTHMGYTLYSRCGYPPGFSWMLLFFMITQLMLFMNFYKKAYKSNRD